MTTVCLGISQAFRIGVCCHRPAFASLRRASLLSRIELPTRGSSAFSTTSRFPLKRQIALLLPHATLPHTAIRHFSKQSVPAAQPVEHHEPGVEEDVAGAKSKSAEDPPLLTQPELNDIFGQEVDREGAAELLSRLQRQRREGTLDEGLPYPEQLIERGLEYLRARYPIDEDGAIIARLDMELDGHWSLPQMYPEKSPTGRSVLEEMRKANKARREKEDAKLDAELAELKLRRQIRQIREAEKAHRKAKALQIADERGGQRRLAFPQKSGIVKTIQGPTTNPSGGKSVAFSEAVERQMQRVDKWIISSNQRVAQLRSNATLPELPQMTRWQRIWRCGLFALAAVGFGLAIAHFYVPPSPNARLFPQVSPATATVGTIIAINAVVFVMWRVPQAWKFVNRYFMVVPAVPRAFQMLGAEFSHQKPFHLLANMVPIWFLGTQLHNDIGRGPFIGLVLCGAVIPSFCALLPYVWMRIFITSTVGASGIVTTFIAASCVLHEGRKITILGLPPETTSWINTGVLLPCFVLLEVVNFSQAGLMSKAMLKSTTAPVDYVGHLAGYATGIVAGYLIRQTNPYWNSIRRESFWNKGGPYLDDPNAKDPAVDDGSRKSVQSSQIEAGNKKT